MARDTKNFKVSEFACHCGCGFNVIDQRVINVAQAIRDALGVPVHVNSGCRCEKHNTKVGGVQKKVDHKTGKVISKGSNHLYGLAADLSCSKGSKVMFETVKKLHAEGKLPDLDYCIRYKWGIHIDCGGKRKTLWEVRA